MDPKITTPATTRATSNMYLTRPFKTSEPTTAESTSTEQTTLVSLSDIVTTPHAITNNKEGNHNNKWLKWKSNYVVRYILLSTGYSLNISDCFSNQASKKRYISKPYHFKLATAKECQLKCQERQECQYFQLSNGVDCYLKNTNAVKVAKPNKCCIFGPKYCEPPVVNDTESGRGHQSLNGKAIHI